MIDLVVKNMIENSVSNLHSCMVCRVTSTTPLSVVPIHKKTLPDGSQENYPVIVGARQIGGFKYVDSNGATQDVTLPLLVGDRVITIFCDKAIDGVGTRKHDITDAIVIGKLV